MNITINRRVYRVESEADLYLFLATLKGCTTQYAA